MSKRKAEIGDRVSFRDWEGAWRAGWVRLFDRLWVGDKRVHAYDVDDGSRDDADIRTNGAACWCLCLARDIRKITPEGE